jgi:hypothetical protein
MKHKKRILTFFKLVDWEKLDKRWSVSGRRCINNDISLGQHVMNYYDIIVKYWEENPEQRIGQVLINLGLINDSLFIWLDTEEDILESFGIPLSEFLLWGNAYDKNMNRLPEINWIRIKDMNTDHIKSVLNGEWTKHPKYIKAFTDELNLRKKQ